MLESVAKTKWCPLVRVSNGNNAVGNFARFDCNCIGTSCMMFQVTVEARSQDVVNVTDLDSPSKDFTANRVIRETEGYCGLARRV